MPLYEYVCPKHGKFEMVNSIHSGDSTKCPQCGLASQRILSSPAVIRVIHTEKLPWYARERVDDRARLMKDTKVKKMLRDYKEETLGGS